MPLIKYTPPIRITLVKRIFEERQMDKLYFVSNLSADVCRAVCKGPNKRVRITITFMRVTKVVGPADGHKKDVDSIRVRMRGYEIYRPIQRSFIAVLIIMCN